MTTIRIYSIMKPTTTYAVGCCWVTHPGDRWDAGSRCHVEYAVFVGVRDTGGTLGLNFSNPNAQKWTHIMRFCDVPDFNVIWRTLL